MDWLMQSRWAKEDSGVMQGIVEARLREFKQGRGHWQIHLSAVGSGDLI